MPLKRGASKATRQANIEEMIASGHPPKVAVAAAYHEQRESLAKKRKYRDHMSEAARHLKEEGERR